MSSQVVTTPSGGHTVRLTVVSAVDGEQLSVRVLNLPEMATSDITLEIIVER